MFEFSALSEERLQGVEPELVFVFRESLKYSLLDFGIAPDGGVRTAYRQNEMYHDANIKTYADGFTKLSDHQIKPGKQYGEALDFIVWLNNGLTWHKTHFAIVGGHIMSTAQRLKCGGHIDIVCEWGATYGSRNYHGWDSGHIGVKS